jgi:1,2-dihydroxy-3-keto-5-methylthiopentene dioxygenase
MAVLRLMDGTVLTDLDRIQAELAPLGVELKHWPVGEVAGLLAAAVLTDDQKAEVLVGLDHYFQILQEQAGYQDRDLIVLHPGIPTLTEMLAKFDRIHTHADDEVRYIVDGEGVFGFVRPDGSQVHLTVQAEEYINVPAGTEHWFYLTEGRRVKAVRYFTTVEGWVPDYTGTPVQAIQSTQTMVR